MTTIEEIEARVKVLELEAELMKARFSARIHAAVNGAVVANGQQAPAGEVASDADLDGEHGDQPVRRDPSAKYWTGQSYVGVRLSQCPPEYLDATAKYREACAYMNGKEGNPEKAKYIEYDKRDAARARGWAKRLREGWGAAKLKGAKPAAAVASFDDEDDASDHLPF